VDAIKDFAELIRRFPNSEYSADAAQRITYLNNILARHEIHVARYYMKRGAYIAAVNRAKDVVENYQRTPAVRDALEIMAEAYDRLELPELAADTRRVIAVNDEEGTFVAPPKLQESLLTRVWNFLELDKN